MRRLSRRRLLGILGVASGSLTAQSQRPPSGQTAAKAGSTGASATSTPRPIQVWKGEDGRIIAGEESAQFHQEFESLPSAIDHAFGHSTNVIVGEGRYSHAEPVYLPDNSHMHFQNAVLQPDGCHGIVTGDGEEGRTNQLLTGKVEIEPDEGDEPATTGLFVHGSKYLQIDGSFVLREGAREAAMRVDGGREGSWWNGYKGLAVLGRYHQAPEAEAPPNAQNFLQCLFRGQFDIDGGNSLLCTDCWWETINDGETIELNAESATLHGRFEAVDLNVATSHPVDIHVVEETRLEIDESVEEGGNVSIRHADLTETKLVQENEAPLVDLARSGTDDESTTGLLQLRQTGEDPGESRLLRMATTGEEGVYLSGETGDELDKAIEVNGDYRNESEGRGVVLTTPDGSAQYRIHLDNDGEIVTSEI